MSAPAGFWQRMLAVGAIHPAYCLAFLLVASVAAALGLQDLAPGSGFEAAAEADAPDRLQRLQAVREFGSDNRTFVHVRDERLWSPDKLQALERLRGELRQLPFVERIDDVFTFAIARSGDDGIDVRPALAAAPPDAIAAESARRAVLGDPMALRHLVGADGNSLAIGIAIKEGAQEAGADHVRDAIERALAPARAQLASVVQIGPAAIEAELRSRVRHDLALLGPLSFLLVALALYGLGGNLRAGGVGVLAAAFAVLWTLGGAGHLGVPLGIDFVPLPALAAALGASEVARFLVGRQAGPPAPAHGAARAAAIAALAERFGGPALLSLLTIALGFGAQAFLGVAALKQAGLAAAFALLCVGVATIMLLPLLETAAAHAAPAREAITRGLGALAARSFLVVRRRSGVAALAVLALAGAAAALLAPPLVVNHDPLAALPADSPLADAARRMQDELAGAKLFYITLDANKEGAFLDPANIERLAEIQAFVAKQRIFDRSLSLADVVSRTHRAAAGGREDAYKVPATRALVSQYVALQRPYDLQPYVSRDFRHANIVVRHGETDAGRLERHLQELRLAVAHYAGPSMTTSVVGAEPARVPVERLLKRSAAVLAALLAFVFVMMSLMFTTPKSGAVALAACAAPPLLVLGAMRVLEVPLGIATGLVAIVAIGITVQGVGHLFSRYGELCRDAASYDEALLEAIRQEAAPATAVGLTAACAFAPLLLSGLTPVVRFGALAMAAGLLSIVVVLLIAPLLMSRLRLVGLYEMLAMSMQREAVQRCPLFAGLSSYEIRKTILLSELRAHRDGDYLIRQGSFGRSMYLVVTGTVEVMRQDDGREHRLAVLRAGDIFGEIGFVSETYRTADARAVGDVSVLKFDHARLEKDLALFPRIMAKLNFNISGILGKRLAELVEAKPPRES